MTPSRKSFLVALAITLPVLACSPPPKQASAGSEAPAASAPAAAAPAAAAGSSDVVATIGSESITMADLEKAVKAQLIEVDNQRYEILEEGLGNLVSEKVLGLEAKATGKTVEQYQQELMSASVPGSWSRSSM